MPLGNYLSGAKGKALGVIVLLVIVVVVSVVLVRKYKSPFSDRFGSPSPCGEGTTEKSGRCLSKDELDAYYAGRQSAANWAQTACQIPWDPAAVAESQALAQMGSFVVDQYGTKTLNKAVNDQIGIPNQELIRLMKFENSGAP